MWIACGLLVNNFPYALIQISAKVPEMKAFMRVLVQNTNTKLYFGREILWTIDPDQAFNFERTLRALDFMQRSKIKNVQIVMKFDDDQFDIHLSPAKAHRPAVHSSS
ncbi:hypothetical protein Cflav_PD0980 [Pedosphaera parvula Ellin514]|uniref:Uncharacterized protein n=2 Tax=Pedosphaera TaxID=1032526 RepID=B9XQ97_PEDPL|nr:hypothetical protein Cflav_PD0980 [Pedosphaera parvula Ellin514]